MRVALCMCKDGCVVTHSSVDPDLRRDDTLLRRDDIHLLLRQQSQLQRERDVLCAVRESQFVADPLLVCIHCFWTDKELLADFWRRVALCGKAQHVLLPFGKPLEPCSLGVEWILLCDTLGQNPCGTGAYEHVAACNGANCVDQFAICCVLHEISGGASFARWYQVVVLRVHREHKYARS